MLSDFAIFTTIGVTLLELAGWGILFLLWWPLRKSGAVRALPWFLAALVLSWAVSTFSRSASVQAMQTLNAMQLSGTTVSAIAMANFFLSTLWKFLCYLLLLANAAYLLDRLGFTSRVIGFFKGLYHFTVPLGIALLVTSALQRSVCGSR